MEKSAELVAVEQEHFRLCAEAGKLQYEHKCLEQKIHELNLKISEVTQKHIELVKPKLEAVPPAAVETMPDDAKIEGDTING